MVAAINPTPEQLDARLRVIEERNAQLTESNARLRLENKRLSGRLGNNQQATRQLRELVKVIGDAHRRRLRSLEDRFSARVDESNALRIQALEASVRRLASQFGRGGVDALFS